jgi:ATP-dependent protease ClpP protease subunit
MADTATTTYRPLTEEELDKLRAEAEGERAETERRKAETARILSEKRSYDATAEVAEMQLAKCREDEAARVKSDDHLRVYRFAGAVTADTAAKCMRQLVLWDRLDPECDIEIVFNSPGGDVLNGMALFDQIASMSKRGGGTHEITIGTRGYAASMAGILLQAADVRWMGKQSYLMIHEISAGAGGKIGEITDAVKFYEAICARVVDIFVARSEGKCSKAKFVKGWLRTDWWLLSDEALKHGFVDEVR